MIHLKYGRSHFQMETFPGCVGGTLKGVLFASAQLPAEAPVVATLRCVEKTRSSDNKSTWEKTIWEEKVEQVRFQPSGMSGQNALRVEIPIPADGRPTTAYGGESGIHWMLSVAAATPGVDLRLDFEIPVFGTAYGVTAPVTVAVKPRSEMPGDPEIEIRPSTLGGKEFYYRPFRHMGAVMTVFVFLLIFGGATVLLVKMSAPVIFPIVFGLFTLLFGFIWLSLLAGKRVIIEHKQATVRTTLLGFTTSERNVAAAEIQAIAMKIGMQTGEKVFYDLHFISRNGRKIGAGGMIRNKREAEWIAEEMKRLLNLKAA
jgi:hypothetical protein